MEPSIIPLESGPILIDRVYQRLLDAIADGSLPPGRRIPQNALAERLGVSRQPVSYALHRLKHQGLVQDSGRKGLEVAPVDPVRLRQLYEVRAALDGLAARLAAGHAAHDPARRAALKQALDAGHAITPDAPVGGRIAADVAFHQAIYRLSGNPAIAEMVDPHWAHLRRAMAVVLTALDYHDRAWAEHAAIAACILQGDGAGAERTARQHALGAGRKTEERLGDVAPAAA